MTVRQALAVLVTPLLFASLICACGSDESSTPPAGTGGGGAAGASGAGGSGGAGTGGTAGTGGNVGGAAGTGGNVGGGAGTGGSAGGAAGTGGSAGGAAGTGGSAGGAAGTGGSVGGAAGTAGGGGAAGAGGDNTIGPAGGVAKSDDSKATLDVPAGALSSTVTFDITVAANPPVGTVTSWTELPGAATDHVTSVWVQTPHTCCNCVVGTSTTSTVAKCYQIKPHNITFQNELGAKLTFLFGVDPASTYKVYTLAADCPMPQ